MVWGVRFLEFIWEQFDRFLVGDEMLHRLLKLQESLWWPTRISWDQIKLLFFFAFPFYAKKNWPCNSLYLEHMVVKGDLLNDQELSWPNISKLFVSFLIRQIIDLTWLDLQYPCFSQKLIFKPWVNYGDGYISGHLHTVNWELNKHNISYIPRKVGVQWRAPKLVKILSGQAGLNGGNITKITGWWFQILFYFHPYLGKLPILTNIFQRGWNHQLDKNWLPTACPVKIYAYPSFFVHFFLKGCIAIFTRGVCRDSVT